MTEHRPRLRLGVEPHAEGEFHPAFYRVAAPPPSVRDLTPPVLLLERWAPRLEGGVSWEQFADQVREEIDRDVKARMAEAVDGLLRAMSPPPVDFVGVCAKAIGEIRRHERTFVVGVDVPEETRALLRGLPMVRVVISDMIPGDAIHLVASDATRDEALVEMIRNSPWDWTPSKREGGVDGH